ncbi:aldehyde dehydrogenase family protein [Mycobacterium xenopi]|uniref:Putative succinate-semialdehyde dehydrogenase [NADP(+)] 2 n=2 Tax=Mycobacterium xenopi TaxID=1789 RepID=A0AAD1M236_MYCXE|nr:aldehyde dehydrogenase family protein [Mycobacterium xenopi]MDA3641457.1 aldehyde dehydrogenase family protein [Mycobacterium xenopi]MDA3659653.1 aldehyde dehydrogenase family protein [Mycobacterium xenopi]MDA3664626.1 aldehyde dehydrogenase family protein [Mycobacterium xenopi]ORX21834.1 betaine-aldehyde dehydrogenase [Mycobacterium xenopi]SPX89385.1 betaine aldehyde dehydrogenase [Mycobacterium xenopi]
MSSITDIFLPAGLLIGSDSITQSSGGTHQHIYPATGEPNATIQLAGTTEIDQAVESAWQAHREWMSYSVDRRRDLLIDLADVVHEHLDELSRLNVHDYAVPVSFAVNAVLLERFLRHFAGYADKPHGASTPVAESVDINLIEREPYGVVGVITPWNGSLVVIGSCVAPALAAGNAVVLKPSEFAPFAALRFGELCLAAGLPAGLVNVVPAGPEGGEALVRHPGIRKIHFTGGTATARKVIQAAADNLTPVVAELGGKSANIVFDDADVDAAAQRSAFQGPLIQSGQSCACASRVLVHESIYDAFLERFVSIIESATVGDPFDPGVVFGPVISQSALDRILGTIEEAITQRAGELALGGKRIGGELAGGYYLEPTVFTGVDNRSALAQTETFGPVVAVMKFDDEAEALRIANDTVYGLNAFVQTTDLARAHRVARQLQAGSVWINQLSDMSPQSPYGGYKQSGFGRTGALEGLYEFLQVKNIRIGMS